MIAFQLHDSETQEVLGSVIQTNQTYPGKPLDQIKLSDEAQDEITEGWEDFNKLEETELNPSSVDDFVTWFNENYVTQIERLHLESIQP